MFIALHINDNEQALKLLNDEYSGSDAIIIKVPVSLPYSTNDDQYQSAAGKFIYNYETYRVVKKRMINDTVLIFCVKDHVEGKIRNQMDDAARSITSSPRNHKSNPSVLSFIKDYLPQSISLKREVNPWMLEIPFSSLSNNYSFVFEAHIKQPPRT